MDPEPVRACTLPRAELAGRAADFRALAPALISATVRLRSTPQTLAAVEALVAAESSCCAFLEFEVEEGDEIVVTVR